MNITDKVRYIKYNRLKDYELFLINIIEKLEIYQTEKWPKSIFYHINGNVIFEQDYDSLLFQYNHILIWDKFKNDYKLDDLTIEKIIKEYMLKYNYIEILKPIKSNNSLMINVWNNLKIL